MLQPVSDPVEPKSDEARREELKRRLDDERAKEASKAKRKRPGLL